MISRPSAIAALWLLVLSGSVSADDTATLSNATAGDENGVYAWGPNKKKVTKVGTSPVGMGTISAGMPHVVSFAIGHPPALRDEVSWTNGDDDIPLTYPDPFTIPIKIWVLCSNPGCTSPMDPAIKTDLDTCFVWMNERLRDERAGFSLEQSDGNEWISDQTSTTDAKLKALRQFETSTDCKTNLGNAGNTLSVDGAVNVFMVETVNRDDAWGDSCRTTSRVVLGHAALCATLLHEIGHNLSLAHVRAGMGRETNMMWQISDVREHFTEGQVFRVHFSEKSGLRTGDLTASPDPAWPAARNCNGADKDACPPINLIPWGTP